MRGKKCYKIGKLQFRKTKSFKRILRQIYYRFANLFIDEYWSIHELNEKFFLNFGVSSDKIFLVDHCSGEFENILKLNPSLLLNKTNFCKKYDLPINKKFLLFTGRFVERKNPLLLLEAFSEANLEDDWFLIMVGNGKFEKKLKENALKYKIKNLKFFNFQNQENLIGFLNNAEILILPSIAGETHGNIATEAMQFSCALILSNMVGYILNV